MSEDVLALREENIDFDSLCFNCNSLHAFNLCICDLAIIKHGLPHAMYGEQATHGSLTLKGKAETDLAEITLHLHVYF